MWSYSNYGYDLLGRVVELTAGQDMKTYAKAPAFLELERRHVHGSLVVGNHGLGERHISGVEAAAAAGTSAASRRQDGLPASKDHTSARPTLSNVTLSTSARMSWIPRPPSASGSASASHPASALMSSAVMSAPSSVRNRFSSRTFRLNGSRSTSGSPAPAAPLP